MGKGDGVLFPFFMRRGRSYKNDIIKVQNNTERINLNKNKNIKQKTKK